MNLAPPFFWSLTIRKLLTGLKRGWFCWIMVRLLAIRKKGNISCKLISLLVYWLISMKNVFTLENLEVYKSSRELSKLAWDVYVGLELDQKIIIGQQFVKSTDSVGANIAEGYGRYHYLDKIRFYYNSRASLFEAIHLAALLNERGLIDEEKYM